MFQPNFAFFPWHKIPADAKAIDIGCGNVQWSRQVSQRVSELHCIESNEYTINAAQRSLAESGNIRFHLARDGVLPLEDNSMDFGYSLGSWNYSSDGAVSLRAVVAKLKPGAPFLAHLPYALDNQPVWYLWLWAHAYWFRKIFSPLPLSCRRLIWDLIAILVYFPLARTAKILETFGVNLHSFPLSAYRNRSFQDMKTAARTRFGALLDKRFALSEVKATMEQAGLESIQVSPDAPFWCVIAYKSNAVHGTTTAGQDSDASAPQHTPQQSANRANPHRRLFRAKMFSAAVIVASIPIFLGFSTNVSTNVDATDEQALRQQMGLKPERGRPLTFDEEINFIRFVQEKTFALAPINRGIPEFEQREPADLFRLGFGLCYDRSRTIEKALTFSGFETRHVYILFSFDKSFLTALFSYRQPSHAVTEVLTKRGWLLIDSNSPWISLDTSGNPVAADQISRQLSKFGTVPDFVREKFWIIRGMYSRKGFFYRPYLPFPEMNWSDFFRSLVP